MEESRLDRQAKFSVLEEIDLLTLEKFVAVLAGLVERAQIVVGFVPALVVSIQVSFSSDQYCILKTWWSRQPWALQA